MSHYNPVPARAWSRVQNRCDYTQDELDQIQMRRKGIVLQYGRTQCRGTQTEKYADLARGKSAGRRTTTFSTQTQSYSNPNTRSLKRVNYTTHPNDENIFSYPSVGCPGEPIRDGGLLVCNITAPNPCGESGAEIVRATSAVICTSTTASDVPGAPIMLCRNTGDPSQVPQPRRTMGGTSSNSFPAGHGPLASAVALTAPVLSTLGNGQLEWEIAPSVIPTLVVEMYLDGAFWASFAGSDTQTTVALSGVYTVVSVNTDVSSAASNPVTISSLDLS